MKLTLEKLDDGTPVITLQGRNHHGSPFFEQSVVKPSTFEAIKNLEAELERVKKQKYYLTNQYHQKSKRLHEKNSIIDVLRVEKAELQAENERFKGFVKKWQKTTLDGMMDLEDKVQELLKEKK